MHLSMRNGSQASSLQSNSKHHHGSLAVSSASQPRNCHASARLRQEPHSILGALRQIYNRKEARTGQELEKRAAESVNPVCIVSQPGLEHEADHRAPEENLEAARVSEAGARA